MRVELEVFETPYCNIFNQFQQLEERKAEMLQTELLKLKNNLNLLGALGIGPQYGLNTKFYPHRLELFEWQ